LILAINCSTGGNDVALAKGPLRIFSNHTRKRYRVKKKRSSLRMRFGTCLGLVVLAAATGMGLVVGCAIVPPSSTPPAFAESVRGGSADSATDPSGKETGRERTNCTNRAKPFGLLALLACLAALLIACQSSGPGERGGLPIPEATATSPSPTAAPTAPLVPTTRIPQSCPPLLAPNAPPTPSSDATASPLAAAPRFLYVHENELLECEYSKKAGPTLVAELADFGATLDAFLLHNLVFALREQGLQRVNLVDGLSELVVEFDPPALFGMLMPFDGERVIYDLAVDAPQAFAGMGTVIGLFQLSSGSGRIVLSSEGSMTLLGQTADRRGLYLLPRGQDRSVTRALEVSLASGETTAQLPLTGDDASLSPERHFILTLSQGGFVVHDLTSVPPRIRGVALPDMPSHARELVWSTNGYAFFSLLAGNYYDYDPDHPPLSYVIWRLDAKTGQLCQITQGQREERQLLAVSPDGQKLVTGDLRGTVLFWDMDTGRITAQLTVPQGELYADGGPDPSGNWLLLRHTQEGPAVLVHLPTGTGESFTLPGGAVFVGWREQGDR
jgi:hypothetical protein